MEHWPLPAGTGVRAVLYSHTFIVSKNITLIYLFSRPLFLTWPSISSCYVTNQELTEIVIKTKSDVAIAENQGPLWERNSSL